LIAAYQQVKIGNPLEPGVLMGPLINRQAVGEMQAALRALRDQGGRVLYGGEPLRGPRFPGGRYVRPCIAAARHDCKIVQEETFAPILYVISYETLDEALAWHNEVPQGLSSAIFTNDLREAEQFLSAGGSDCGIANVKRESWNQRRRNRGRLRRGKGDGGRAREWQRRVEGLHAAADRHRQLLPSPAFGPRHCFRLSARPDRAGGELLNKAKLSLRRPRLWVQLRP